MVLFGALFSGTHFSGTLASGLVASLPSPSTGSISIGPLNLRMYGLCIALGVIAGVWLLGRQLERRGYGNADDASAIGMWAVGAGIIGARLYHVATDWSRFEDNLGAIPKIWEGGLGIPGGLLAGILVGVWVGGRRGIPAGVLLTCAAPAIPLAQAIGRWGNWFNQELFGRPTDLPWALEIDDEHLPAGYVSGTTFHPTFLYESLWNLGLCGVLLWIDRKFKLGPGRLMAVYLIGYGTGRFWIEGLRIDAAHEGGGLRLNQWVALVAVIGGVLWLMFDRREWPEVQNADTDNDTVPADTDTDTETGTDTETNTGTDTGNDTALDDFDDAMLVDDETPENAAEAESSK